MSLITHLKYHFENAISKTSRFVVFLFVSAVLLGLLFSLINEAVTLGVGTSFSDFWWHSVTEIMDLGEGDNLYERVFSILFWIGNIGLSGTVIGFLSSKISVVVANLQRGRSVIIDTNHYLIIGWSNTIYDILNEISIANENQKKASVVIFSMMSNIEMQDQISHVSKALSNLKIITRHGNPSIPEELSIVNPRKAKSILIIKDFTDTDAKPVARTLALKAALGEISVPVVVEVNEESTAEKLSMLDSNNLVCFSSKTLISNIAAQSCRGKGVLPVVLDFLDYDGSEIYCQEYPELSGKTYLEAMFSFDSAALIGIVTPLGEPILNPPHDYVIAHGSQQILISEDDGNLHYKPCDTHLNPHSIVKKAIEESPLNLIFVGWSETASKVAQKVMQISPIGSKVTVIYDDSMVAKSTLELQMAFDHNSIEFRSSGSIELDVCELHDQNPFDGIFIIGYTDVLKMEEADTESLLKRLVLGAKLSNSENTRMIMQLFDSSKSEYMDQRYNEDLILNNKLSAMLMTQLADNPLGLSIINQLFDVSKASIHIMPIADYIGPDDSIIPSNDLYKAAASKGQSFVGYLKGNDSDNIVLNPSKSQAIKISEVSSIIVIQ